MSDLDTLKDTIEQKAELIRKSEELRKANRCKSGMCGAGIAAPQWVKDEVDRILAAKASK